MGKYNIAIDLGGTIIKIALFRDGVVVDTVHLDAQSAQGLAGCLPRVADAIDKLMSQQYITTDRLGGAGISFAGLVDPIRKKVLSTNKKYDDACDFDLEAWVRQHWGVPFCIDNDARLATIGEWKRGAAAGYDNLVTMTLGTGIGTGVVIEGKVLYGKHFQAGSLGGHLVIDYKGRDCSCGSKGCVEAMASSFFLPEIIRAMEELSTDFRARADALDFKQIFALAASGDADALKVRNECLDVWASAVVTYIHAYDPEIVVIGGGVAHSWDVIGPHIEHFVSQRAWTPWGKVKIVPSILGNNAALAGIDAVLSGEIRPE